MLPYSQALDQSQLQRLMDEDVLVQHYHALFAHIEWELLPNSVLDL